MRTLCDYHAARSLRFRSRHLFYRHSNRRLNGVLRPNEKFPEMKALADYVHSKGLKIGIYSLPGSKTCARVEGTWKDGSRTHNHSIPDATCRNNQYNAKRSSARSSPICVNSNDQLRRAAAALQDLRLKTMYADARTTIPPKAFAITRPFRRLALGARGSSISSGRRQSRAEDLPA